MSDSDGDNRDDYLTVKTTNSIEGKYLLQKKIKSICLKNKRKCASTIASRNFLGRKRSKKVTGILQKYPTANIHELLIK